MKPLLLLPALLVLAYLPASTGSPVPQKAASSAASGEKTPAISNRVKEIWKIDCAMCHGDTGDGKTDLAKGMNLSLNDFGDPKTFDGKSDQQLFDMIRKGKGNMPPEDTPRASDDQVKGLVQYIRTFSKDRPAAAPAAQPAAQPAAEPAPAQPPAGQSTSPTSN